MRRRLSLTAPMPGKTLTDELLQALRREVTRDAASVFYAASAGAAICRSSALPSTWAHVTCARSAAVTGPVTASTTASLSRAAPSTA